MLLAISNSLLTYRDCLLSDNNPRKLQSIIRKLFELATSRIRIDGTDVYDTALPVPRRHSTIYLSSHRLFNPCQVVAVPTFAVLDGSDSRDYEARVEPSAAGGRKFARLLLDAAHVEEAHAESAAMAAVPSRDGAAVMQRLWRGVQAQHDVSSARE